MHGAAYKSFPKVVQLLADKGARIEVWNRKNKYGWTPLSIAEGHRPGNFKPSPETIAALHSVMLAAGVSPLPTAASISEPQRLSIGHRAEGDPAIGRTPSFPERRWVNPHPHGAAAGPLTDGNAAPRAHAAACSACSVAAAAPSRRPRTSALSIGRSSDAAACTGSVTLKPR